KTVGTVRRGLEARSEIPNVTTRTDTKGRAQPANKKSHRTDKPAAKTKASRSVDELAAREQPAETTVSQPQTSGSGVSRVAQPLPNNMISQAWMRANASQRTEFVKAHWIDIMWVRDLQGGAGMPGPTPPRSSVDAVPADMVVTPETEAQRSQA